MPNYIRTQNPWIAAAESMQQVASPLANMYMQLPQVRAQMQRHADEMGIRQGQLDLSQQELGMKAPVYNAQAGNYNAEAGLHNQQAANLGQLLQFAMQGANADTNPLTKNMTGAALLSPDSAQRMRGDVTKPMTLNQNETAFTNPEMGQVSPLAQGIVNAPFGNTVMQGMQLGGTNQQPAVIQQGQFRPPGSMQLDPSTAAFNLARVAEVLDSLGMDEQQLTPLLQAASSRALGGQQQQSQVPVPAQRQPGQVYQTPKGPLKWTGTGWVTP